MNSLMNQMQMQRPGMDPRSLAALQQRMGAQAQPVQQAVDPRFLQQAQQGGMLGGMGVPPPRQLLQQNLMQNAAQQGGMRDMAALMQRMKTMGGPVQPSRQMGQMGQMGGQMGQQLLAQLQGNRVVR